MKLKDIKNEIKVLDIAALMAKSEALKIEINDLVLDKNINRLKDMKSIDKKRKHHARILTALAQKELIGKLESTGSEAVKEPKAEKVEKTEQVKKGVNK